MSVLTRETQRRAQARVDQTPEQQQASPLSRVLSAADIVGKGLNVKEKISEKKLEDSRLFNKGEFTYSWEGQEPGNLDRQMIVPNKQGFLKGKWSPYYKQTKLRDDLVGSKIGENQAFVPDEWKGTDWTNEKVAEYLENQGASEKEIGWLTKRQKNSKTGKWQMPFREQADKLITEDMNRRFKEESDKHALEVMDEIMNEEIVIPDEWKSQLDFERSLGIDSKDLLTPLKTKQLAPGLEQYIDKTPKEIPIPGAKLADGTMIPNTYQTVGKGKFRDKIIRKGRPDMGAGFDWKEFRDSRKPNLDIGFGKGAHKDMLKRSILGDPTKAGNPTQQILRQIPNIGKGGVKNLFTNTLGKNALNQVAGSAAAGAGAGAGAAANTGLLAGMGPAGWTMMALGMLGGKIFKPHTFLGKLFG